MTRPVPSPRRQLGRAAQLSVHVFLQNQCHAAASHPTLGAYLDFVLAILPLSFIIELKVELRKRIVLCLILGLGIV